jgi:hypothetical protein
MRDNNGKFATKPKFFVGQVVKTSDKHYSKSEVIILDSRNYVKGKGWYYGEEYCHLKDGNIIAAGGYCSGNKEDFYEEIEDPTIKIAIEKFYRQKEKEKIEERLKILNSEISKIEYTQKLLIRRENE